MFHHASNMISRKCSIMVVKCGEGKTRNEFAEWHVAWLAE